jgi:hypothetical protein
MRPLLAALGVLAVAVALTMLVASRGSGSTADNARPGSPTAGTPRLSASASVGVGSGGPSAAGTGAGTSSLPSGSAVPSAAGLAASAGPVEVAIVPVTNFRATPTSTNLREVEAVLAGTSGRYQALELVAAEADSILVELGLSRPTAPGRLVLAPDAAALAADLTKSGKRLGFLRADAVGPSVRALAWGRDTLFGGGRLTGAADWPLVVGFPPGTPEDAFEPAATWTLFAGGDILLDRGVYKTVVV